MKDTEWMDMTIEEARELAATPTPTAEGKWMLIGPEGAGIFHGASPMECLRKEQEARVPPRVAAARLRLAMVEDGE